MKIDGMVQDQIDESINLIKSMEIRLSKGDTTITEQMMRDETYKLLDLTKPIDKPIIKQRNRYDS